MGWVRFPLDRGAVNSRSASQLEPGEFTRTSGVRYKPGDSQIHSDLTWATMNFSPNGLYGYNWIGPWYLNFEGKNDWLMLVSSSNVSGEVVGKIHFARADGTAAWQVSSYVLNDNVGNRDGVSAASVTHWGDRYYLATDQGCVEIVPPTGTGAPTVERLGMLYYDNVRYVSNTAEANGNGSRSIIPIGSTVAGTVIGGDPGSISWALTEATSDLEIGDFVSVFITEYDSERGVESYPIWYDSRLVQSSSEFPTITFPSAFINDSANKFRVYLKLWYNTVSGSSVFEDNSVYNSVIAYESALVGSSLLSKDGYEFDASDSVQFAFIQKNSAFNSLPVIGVDAARLIFPAYRYPKTSTVCAVWNDSLVIGDSGFDDGIDTDGEADPIFGTRTDLWGPDKSVPVKTVLRYSPAGEPYNQPVPYFLNFASEREDAIKGLVVVNDRLLVLCDQACHTVRYLPFNNLLASQQGRVKDVLTTNVGLASPRAVAKIETARGEMAVWLSHRGLEWTDGTMWDDACRDFKLDEFDEPSQAVLVNMSSEYRLDLYLGSRLYSFYYHPDHLKNGRLKMLGPTSVRTDIVGACEYKGTAYRFDGATMYWTNTDQTGGSGSMYTGYLYGNNPFKDLIVKDLALTHDDSGATITARADGAVAGRALEQGSAVTIGSTDIEETTSAGVSQRGNYVRFNFTLSGSEPCAIGPAWMNIDEESGGLG